MTQEVQSMLRVARPLRYLLIAGSVVSALAVLSGISELILLKDLINGVYDSEDLINSAVNANDIRQQVLRFIQVGIFFLAAIIFSIWIYRANVGVRALGAENLRTSPGWAVGWFLIPIMSFWKPYQALSDLWRASSDPKKWDSVCRSSILPIWWFFWLVSLVLSNVSFRLSLQAESFDEFWTASIVTLASDLVDVPSFLIAYALVSQISGFQERYTRS